MEQRDNQVEQHMENTSKIQHGERAERWPELPYEAWRETCQTLHLWIQIVGKVRMALSPYLNHWWHVTLYVTPCGLTTSAIPYHSGTFDVNFDIIEHNISIRTSEGTTSPRSIAAMLAMRAENVLRLASID